MHCEAGVAALGRKHQHSSICYVSSNVRLPLLYLQVLDTTCVVSAVLIDGAKQKAEEVAKQAADTALQARRGSGGGAASAASSNGSNEPAAAASGKKASGGKVSFVLGPVLHSTCTHVAWPQLDVFNITCTLFEMPAP